jgi:pseudaminic acid biosynthesis-associated methylase
MDALYAKEFGTTRSALNEEFLASLDRSSKILEVGANVGSQLQGLQRMGFTNLYGVELQPYAVEVSKARTKNINLIQGTAFDIPYRSGYFDLVFTSGVLIHISPADVGTALDEIHRCSNRYIWGFEYFAETYTDVLYRGKKDLLWKTNFAKLYLDRFKDLKLVKEKRVKYLSSDNVDSMYLLEKVAR